MPNDTPVRTDLYETYHRGLENRLQSIEDSATKDHKSILDIFKTLHERSDRALDEAVEEVKAARVLAKEAKDTAKEPHPFCLEHTGFKGDIGELENKVKELWKKYNWIIALLIMNLIGIIFILLRFKGAVAVAGG